MTQKQNNILAIIPARAGSKRLPKKNIMPLGGLPLIAWTIKSALEARLDMDVVVSTESEQIAKVALEYGADIPFMRPDELAQDASSSFDVIDYTLKTLAASGRHYDYVILLQPTSPFRQSQHIEEAFLMLQKFNANAVVSVTELDHPVEWSMTLPDSGNLDEFIHHHLTHLKTRSQDLPKRYRLNGAISCGQVKALLSNQTFYVPSGTYAYKMEPQFSVDIDTLTDFQYAEFLQSRL
ncbi:cytidylyltransferase domain-containing protein [Thiomicrospira pelophila]|uniref:acylneuraminate cytidylyltransferase family protein n=1 Tax=Thiomicrospira pelophila TaxID=934 RepID=UPI0004A730A2|nr:acylneuraminate cytidylyltransferase family protein [Thiomicrospira pelophila]